MHILILIIGIIIAFVGYFIGYIFDNISKNFISLLLEITAGIMTSVVCFEMIPESISSGGISISVLGLLFGAIFSMILDYIFKKNGIAIVTSMFIHNIIEGMAIGCGFFISYYVGIALLISTLVHDLPESMIVGIALRKERSKNKILKTLLIGSSTAIGSYCSFIIPHISNNIISFCIAFAGGCMLYIVSCDMLLESKSNTKNKFINFTFIIGIILGILITSLEVN